MSTTPTIPGSPSTVTPGHYLADLYTFKWSALNLRLPLVSASAVGLCLFIGIFAGHPGSGLIAGGGALTVGFGANQRIADSRLLPMIAAVLAMASTTLIGTLAGNRGYTLLLAAGIAAFIYGVLTSRNAGLAWVGQQASVTLFVASGYPTGPRPALVRAGLIAAGGTVQILITTFGLRLMPELRKDLLAIPRSLYTTLYQQHRELLNRLHDLPQALPALSGRIALLYSLRLTVTVVLASELYRRLGIQSGYWIPMTALLVQKPAFFETLARASARILGTLAGAYLCSLLIADIPIHPLVLAAATTFCAFWAFATNGVNYGLFSLFLTSYIVFLLSLNQIPGPEIAHRRALCTLLGGLIALAIHIDALHRHRVHPANP